jgi:hypothetical protein
MDELTFGEKVVNFYSALDFRGILPKGIRVMNPFKNNPETQQITRLFYHRFFNDYNKRTIILGINPGRFGAGITGIPFTDTIRLNEKCNIPFSLYRTFEPSSVFIYQMIERFGSVDEFYSKFFISAVCPLGFTVLNSRNREVNYNYYDNPELTSLVYDFVLDTLKQQLSLGINTEVCFCLGTGKNEVFLRKLNNKHGFFRSVIALEHPRFIMQYKSKQKDYFIEKYIETLKTCSHS